MNYLNTSCLRSITDSVTLRSAAFNDACGHIILILPLPAKLPAKSYQHSTRTVRGEFIGVNDAFSITSGSWPSGKHSDSDPYSTSKVIHQRQSAHWILRVQAMVSGSVAQPEGGLHAGSGLRAAVTQGRPAGRRQFCLPELLELWVGLQLPYVVVAQLSEPIQKMIKGDLKWTATEVPGTEVAEMEYQTKSWPHPRRLVLLRHQVSEDEERCGKRLLDAPGYRFQALVTSLPQSSHPPLSVWRYYNGRADCENVIKELQAGFALPTLCLESFWASEAALSLATLTYNLLVLFERHLGWQQKVTIRNLRFWLFLTAGVLTHRAGRTTIKLAVLTAERDWWRRLWEKIINPIPNCNAVENRPALTG